MLRFMSLHSIPISFNSTKGMHVHKDARNRVVIIISSFPHMSPHDPMPTIPTPLCLIMIPARPEIQLRDPRGLFTLQKYNQHSHGRLVVEAFARKVHFLITGKHLRGPPEVFNDFESAASSQRSNDCFPLALTQVVAAAKTW